MVWHALKKTSDALLEEKMSNNGVTPDAAVAKEELREIRGVMRVGGLAVKTMIKEENTVELVVTCANKPTADLLVKISSLLLENLKMVCQELAFTVRHDIEGANLVLTTVLTDEEAVKELMVKVYLTATSVRTAPKGTAEGRVCLHLSVLQSVTFDL